MCKERKLKEQISFVEFDRIFLRKSFDWLSEPETKRLTDTPDITLDKQEQWFQSLPTKKDYYVKGIQVDGIPIGAVGIKNITTMQGEYWGYIGEKSYWEKGIGRIMVAEMIQIAKNDFCLGTLYLKVLSDNDRAIALYKKMGFIVDKIEGKKLRMICMLSK